LSRATAGWEPRAGGQTTGPYFLDLVVDFFDPPFLLPELLEPDLLLAFFAMALYLLSCPTNLRGANFVVNDFF
jgi:hypothetical protein